MEGQILSPINHISRDLAKKAYHEEYKSGIIDSEEKFVKRLKELEV